VPSSSRPRRRIRIGLALRRRPALRWALVALTAGGAGLAVTNALSRAEAARAAWGSPERVLVATRDLEVGRQIRSEDVELVDRPTALVPSGATDDPIGRIVHSPVFDGEVVVDGRLAQPGQRGLAARVPPGQRAVAIPREPGTTPDLEAGQRVDLIVVLPPDASGVDSGPPGLVVAAGAVVVDVAEEATTIAVDEEDATRVAVALALGVVTLALAGG
jgi:Flp pilus assembly protein CpaB